MNQDQNIEQPTSRHAVTDRVRCYQIEQKYGWKLLRIELTGDSTLKYICVFEGATKFPNYQED